MIVTATDLKTNLGKYLDLLETEEIIVTRNGRKIAKLVKEDDDTLADIRALYGILAGSELSIMTDEQLKEVIHQERSARYDRVDRNAAGREFLGQFAGQHFHARLADAVRASVGRRTFFVNRRYVDDPSPSCSFHCPQSPLRTEKSAFEIRVEHTIEDFFGIIGRRHPDFQTGVVD